MLIVVNSMPRPQVSLFSQTWCAWRYGTVAFRVLPIKPCVPVFPRFPQMCWPQWTKLTWTIDLNVCGCSRKIGKFLQNSSSGWFFLVFLLQALEETKMNQVRIITELEKEKKKMQDDVLKLKEAKVTTILQEINKNRFGHTTLMASSSPHRSTDSLFTCITHTTTTMSIESSAPLLPRAPPSPT